MNTPWTTHGYARSKTYKAWVNMKARCNNPLDASYYLYGGRGIGYYYKWEFFENFLEDMGPCPEGLTLERRDSAGDYLPENCTWATWTEQAFSRRVSTNTTSKVRGVCSDRKIYWKSYYQENGRQIVIYRGMNFLDAVAKRKAWEAGLL